MNSLRTRPSYRRLLAFAALLCVILALVAGWRERQRRLAVVFSAQAEYHHAIRSRQAAESALAAFMQNGSPQLRIAEEKVALAESERKRAEDRLEQSTRTRSKGAASPDQVDANELSLKKKVSALENAQSKGRILANYTREKTFKELQSDIERSRAAEVAGKAAYERAQSRRKHLWQ